MGRAEEKESTTKEWTTKEHKDHICQVKFLKVLIT
jgi:hypothetical protein